MKSFDIPEFYRSPLISAVKTYRRLQDPRKKDLSPSVLNFGPVVFYLARHFGFCYGVENAIEISFKAIAENPGKRIFLISQMIHNPEVNKDLTDAGVRFLQDTEGRQLIPFDTLSPDDIVIIPAFGTTVETETLLKNKGLEIKRYNTTCPFVERVWKKSEQIGKENFTIVIHGKYRHEETRATFSRSAGHSRAVVVKDIQEARRLARYIAGKESAEAFYEEFAGKYSENFNPVTDLKKIGVINQTTMLAGETQEIADFLKNTMQEVYDEENNRLHFADTRDTLCYATNENQDATLGLLEVSADLALVIGGYNSSNTSHLAELLERKFPTYFISSAAEIDEEKNIAHFNYAAKEHRYTKNFLPQKEPVKIILSSGASCPDALVESVLNKILSFYPHILSKEEVMKELTRVG